MIKSLNRAEAKEVWNSATTIREMVQAIVGQTNYVQLLEMSNGYLVQVSTLPEPALIDQRNVLKGAVFASAHQSQGYEEAFVWFVSYIRTAAPPE
jgi:hypothetical protein